MSILQVFCSKNLSLSIHSCKWALGWFYSLLFNLKNIGQGRGFPTLNMRFWFDKFKGQRKDGFLEEIHSSTTHVQVSVPSEFSCLVKCLYLYLYRTLHVNILFYCGELTRLYCKSGTKRLLCSEKCIYPIFAIHLGFLFHVCSSVLQPEITFFYF